MTPRAYLLSPAPVACDDLAADDFIGALNAHVAEEAGDYDAYHAVDNVGSHDADDVFITSEDGDAYEMQDAHDVYATHPQYRDSVETDSYIDE